MMARSDLPAMAAEVARPERRLWPANSFASNPSAAAQPLTIIPAASGDKRRRNIRPCRLTRRNTGPDSIPAASSRPIPRKGKRSDCGRRDNACCLRFPVHSRGVRRAPGLGTQFPDIGGQACRGAGVKQPNLFHHDPRHAARRPRRQSAYGESGGGPRRPRFAPDRTTLK